MSRPLTFAPADALDAALAVFQRSGFDGTSVQDLVDATGLSRSSLYATFGDKQTLYLAALDRYRTRGTEVLPALLDRAASPLAALRAYFDGIADEPAGARGCFLVNAAAERSQTCTDTARRAAETRDAMSRAFASALRAAQAAGEVPAPRDADADGVWLTGFVYGLRGMQNAGAPAAALRTMVQRTFDALAA